MVVLHTYNPSTWEVKAGGSDVEGHLQQPSKFEAGWDVGVPPTYKQMKEQMNKASF